MDVTDFQLRNEDPINISKFCGDFIVFMDFENRLDLFIDQKNQWIVVKNLIWCMNLSFAA